MEACTSSTITRVSTPHPERKRENVATSCHYDDQGIQLIACFSKGDSTAFDQFYSQYHPKLSATFYNHMYAMSHGHNSAWMKAQDKATDILFHAYHKSESYNPDGTVWEWLLSFSKMRLPGVQPLTERRKEFSYSEWENHKYEPVDKGGDHMEPVPAPDTHQKKHDTVTLIMKNMEPRHAEALHLYANNNNFTRKEMGECLGGITPSKVDALLEKGRQSFCKNLLTMIDPQTLITPLIQKTSPEDRSASE